MHNIIHGTVNVNLQLGEVIEHFSHFVAALTATDVYDTIRVGVLRKGLGNAGLTATEGTWNSTSTTLNSREQGIEDTLSGGQRVDWSELLSARSWGTHGPLMGHSDLLTGTISQLDDSNGICNGVLALWHDFHNSSMALRGSHDDMLVEEVVLEDLTDFVATSYDGAGAFLEVWHESVLAVLIQRGKIDTARYED